MGNPGSKTKQQKEEAIRDVFVAHVEEDAEVALEIALGQFKQWPNRERILLNVERLWREFRGEDPTTSKLNVAEVFLRMDTMAKAGEL